MRIITRSAIEISESLAGFLLGSHIYNNLGEDPRFEKRMKYVDTGKFSIADLYIPSKDCAVEMKSIAHGSSALKGVIQASMYKEQVGDAIFCMEKPSRSQLRSTIKGMAESHGVGVVWITGVPNICKQKIIKKATGGLEKPFELWKGRSYRSTRNTIIGKSQSGWMDEYMATFEQIVGEKHGDLFEFALEPDSSKPGLGDIHPV